MATVEEARRIVRDANGVMDFLFDKLEEVDARPDIELKDKVKMFDSMLRNILGAGRLGLEYKRMIMRAPDIAKSKENVLQLGNGGVVATIEATAQAGSELQE